MSFDNVHSLPEVGEDLRKLDSSVRKRVEKVIKRISENPSTINEGGIGVPLRNNNKTNLSGLCKVKLQGLGIRIVYKYLKTEHGILIIVIAARADDEVYIEAQRRIQKYENL